ncbi:hypothetical protein DTO207G8_6123 [Paecilomyces variotii]|nr:hypothetical protein DTO169C6_4034 [Paecilomyces variotii]KAJ9250354.1 hypothetical protein DTO207G8_6123 [Paecilomyces variotii]KAJ9380200.1 hypothetical protein DTO063F5_6775 [Paecilomyces variotii]
MAFSIYERCGWNRYPPFLSSGDIVVSDAFWAQMEDEQAWRLEIHCVKSRSNRAGTRSSFDFHGKSGVESTS